MLIGVSEGIAFAYEVTMRSDGFLVEMRDLETGALEGAAARLFRSAATAYAYADFACALDRCTVSEAEGDDVVGQLEHAHALFAGISESLHDDGVTLGAVAAWDSEKRADAARLLH